MDKSFSISSLTTADGHNIAVRKVSLANSKRIMIDYYTSVNYLRSLGN
jgi:hypothetical protein